jgi:hypothetical protein
MSSLIGPKKGKYSVPIREYCQTKDESEKLRIESEKLRIEIEKLRIEIEKLRI